MVSMRQFLHDKLFRLEEEPKSKILPEYNRNLGNLSSFAKTGSGEAKLAADTLRKIASLEPLVMKGIRKKNKDTFRNWLVVKHIDIDGKVPVNAIQIINSFDRRTRFKQKLQIAGISSNVWGDGFLEIVYKEGKGKKVDSRPADNAEPIGFTVLNPEDIKKFDKKKGDDTLYYVFGSGMGEEKFIHPDRIIHVKIDWLPHSKFGMSKINMLQKILKSKMNADEASGEILDWFGHGIPTMSIAGMNPEQQKQMLKIFGEHPDYYVFDEDYTFDIKNPTQINPKPFYEYFYANIAAALEMPVHILIGQQIGEVTGSEVGISDYYHDVENIQEMVFTPIIESVYKQLLKSRGLKWKYRIDWNPIFVDEMTEAKILQTRTFSSVQNKNAGIIDAEEARGILNEGVVNLDVSKIPKKEKPSLPITQPTGTEPNVEPQPPVKKPTVKQTIHPLTEVQREMIRKNRLRGEIELIEQDKRLKEASKKVKNGTASS